MRFGRVPVSATLEGAILAHTHRLPNGGAIKKGRRLASADVTRLETAGVRDVTVAVLESDDVHEDEAAARVARLLADATLLTTEAHTGRVNLLATTPGLVEIDRTVIDAINAVSEEVTVATVEPYTVAPAKVMVATIKVIPFAVNEAVLVAIERAVAHRRGAIRIRPFRNRPVGLILSQLPGMSTALLRKASEVQRARVTALGSTIARELRCDHDAQSVAHAIQSLSEEGCDPILILGASAIVDRRDVIPEALERSGGEVVHLGMPVDPGNLLMYGHYDDAVVLGLPGCARSLNPSGFDFVLQRVLADLPVESSVIQSLGVGGLLKEIAGRPQPRSMKKKKDVAPRVAGVILAAGMSRRMGKDNKLLFEVEGVPLVRRVAQAFVRSKVEPVLVVVGHESEKIRDALSDLNVRCIENPDYADGMSTSLRVGISHLQDVDAAVVGLADMPWIRENHVDALLDAYDPGGESTICVPMYGRKRGNPVLWAASHFPQLQALEGDVGGKVLLERFPASICYVAVSDPGVNVDVDTPEALASLAQVQED